MTDEDSQESDDESTPGSVEEQLLDHQSFIMGYRSADVDLRSLHPLPSQVPFMWQIYQENVEPVLKILHVPSINQLIRDNRACLRDLKPSTEALMFSIYYAAVTSMDADDVTRSLGEDKSFLLNRYRFAVEQALAKANFITDPDLTVCQAFVMFLMLVRRHDKARFTWTLTGLAVRICQAIGLHRDGTNFPHLKPFEIEMRRRLFWSLVLLDLRSAEDQGTELIISDRSFDTQFPLNINDADISPDSKDFPPAREGPTDITFCLIRFEICNLARKMYQDASTVVPAMTREDTLKTLEEREAQLLEFYHDLEVKYLQDSSAEQNPMYWVAGNIARVIVAKMITVIYQPVLFALPVPSGADTCPDSISVYSPQYSLSCRLRERLFIAAVEIFEYNHILNTDPRCRQWRWLFRTYTQWHMVAYLLLETCNRSWSATSERAWAAINACFCGPNSLALERMTGHTAVWLPFKKLYGRAKKHRDAELARLRADPPAAEQLDRINKERMPPSTFSVLSISIKCSIAQDRWRKMVNLPPTPPYNHHEETTTAPQPQPTRPPNQDPGNVNMPLPDTHLDDLVAEVMSTPVFDVTQIQRLAFPNAGRADPLAAMPAAARDMVFGYSSLDTPAPARGLSGGAGPAARAPSSGPPLAEDDNPPVWLWNGAEVHKVNQPAAAAAADGGGEQGDVNMDEGLDGFDWQGWQENARGFELETNGAGVNGVWGVWYGI